MLSSDLTGKGTKEMKEKTFYQIFANVVLSIFSILVLIPVMVLVMSSFSEESAAIKYGYSLWPRQFSLGGLSIHSAEDRRSGKSVSDHDPGHIDRDSLKSGGYLCTCLWTGPEYTGQEIIYVSGGVHDAV